MAPEPVGTVGSRSEALKIGRFAAAGAHLLASALVALLGGLLIFRLWFPAPFDAIAGGASLFLLLVCVDVVLGPALTFVAASPGKRLFEFRRDLVVIVVLQLLAFSYGVYTIALARPVLLSFELDRFRVILAADIDNALLGEAPHELRDLSWTGPRQIAAVKPADPSEQLRSIDLALAGFDLSMVPRNWRPYASQADAAWRAARPVSSLIAKYPQQQANLAGIAAEAGQPVGALRFLPVLSRQANWSAIIAAPGARIVGYAPIDGFF